MLLRIWKVGIAPAKAAALEAFANTVSLPMFKAQAGCLGVFFTRTDRHCATVTIWESQQAVDAMETTTLYQDVVRQIEDSGILGSDHQTEVFSVYGGFTGAELAARLADLPRA